MSKGRLRVAIIGTGRWGLQHARVFAAHSDVEICAFVGRTADRTQARAAMFGVKGYLDIQTMIAHEQPDLVSVCLPNQEHFAPTLQVIQAGSALLVEKPLVFDLSEADRLLDEAAKRHLFFAINFNHRYAPPITLARQALQDSRLGALVFAGWQFGGEGTSEHPYANLIETQCHGFDTLEFICGPISSIMAEMTDVTGNGFSTLVLSLRFANGAVGSLIGSYDSSYAFKGAQRLELSGVLGRVLIEDTVQHYAFQRRGSEIREQWQAGYFNDRDRAFHQTFDLHIEHLLAAFRQGLEPPVHARAGRRALALAVAAIQSFETGQRVIVDASEEVV